MLLEEVKRLTPKPVRYVINTHFHFDHAHGNQIFGAGVDIIGHEFTRADADRQQVRCRCRSTRATSTAMPAPDRRTLRGAWRPRRIRRRSAKLADAAYRRPRTTSASQKELPAGAAERHAASTEMTLFRGSREIQIQFLGRGHTGGDVVVFLPREKVVITGDFLTAALSNLSDSYPDEWVDVARRALQEARLRRRCCPGTARRSPTAAKIDYCQAYLRDVWTGRGRD